MNIIMVIIMIIPIIFNDKLKLIEITLGKLKLSLLC